MPERLKVVCTMQGAIQVLCFTFTFAFTFTERILTVKSVLALLYKIVHIAVYKP